jgi:pantoate--beta-alanine ligase
MGAIHKGHISLIKKSLLQSDKTVVSIFINKPQFNRNQDYKKYPRTLKKDILKLKKLKIDYLYLPNNKQIYPNGRNKNIKISTFAKKLCGKFRPGHFKAVVDVIERFIKIIKPKKIYLGQKDMQQLKIIEHYFKQKKIKTDVIPCKTIREKNGLALSSRNYLLSKKQKFIASKVYKLIVNNKHKIINKRSFVGKVKKKIIDLGVSKIDYLELLDVNKIIKPFTKKNNNKIFIAYYINSVRLIDNV